MSERKSRTPSIAITNESNARNNIVLKKNILDAWAKNGIPHVPVEDVAASVAELQLEYFPRTIRQFNFWDGSNNSEQIRNVLPAITRNANDTLRRHPNLRNDVDEAIDAVKQREILQLSQVKFTKISNLRGQIAMEKKLRSILESALVDVRKQQKDDRRSYNDDIAGLSSQIAELKGLLDNLKIDNKEAHYLIASLKTKLVKVAPLKKI
ncbi:hypothetical protein [Noviherbaspirillum suwonense]|uniref:KfrA N-terminal DNA-binding domain-containing protein n=1 Tax=Noviherbaspirillum suwonense TaxID=1224511 RepID=A0ABY1QQQ1_9BURK|nr:hypothetical protein [Noviherbaspirillum suwonense]SMP77696.1 hypothetical protein SAMN06295970_1272 [Noviherbaspirillum suwonense]